MSLRQLRAFLCVLCSKILTTEFAERKHRESLSFYSVTKPYLKIKRNTLVYSKINHLIYIV
jgi:hypothetical protein